MQRRDRGEKRTGEKGSAHKVPSKAPAPQAAPKLAKKPDLTVPVFLGGVVRFGDVERLPLGALPRIAFAGRSNVGKSSLLNALTRARIARVSAEPGKTREMNFFRWALTRDPRDAVLLVDLPGYGYAKVAVELRKQWGGEITRWLKSDESLALVVALVDGRHGFLPNDVELIEFLRDSKLPHLVAFTKMDKYKSANQRSTAERELADVARRLGVAHYVCVSAIDKDGTRPLLAVLREYLSAQQ